MPPKSQPAARRDVDEADEEEEEEDPMSREETLRAVQENGLALRHANMRYKKDRDVVRAAVRQRAEAFQYALEELRSDPDFVQELMRRSERVMLYASDALRSDPEFVMAMAKRRTSFLEYASDELRADRDFIFTVIRETRDGDVPKYAWPNIWEDAEVILAACEYDEKAMRHAGGKAWGNREFVYKMVERDWRDLANATEEVKADRDIAKVALAQSPHALQHVARCLKEDSEIVYRVYTQDEKIAMEHGSDFVFSERDFVLAIAGIHVPPEWVAP